MTDHPVFGIDDIVAAAEIIQGHVRHTPLLPGASLGIKGIDLRLKPENLQTAGVFKVRGALNALANMALDERSRGVVTVSAGNHGIALSYAAQYFDSSATVVMPDTAPRVKIDAIKAYGGQPVLVDGTRLMQNMEEIRDARG